MDNLTFIRIYLIFLIAFCWLALAYIIISLKKILDEKTKLYRQLTRNQSYIGAYSIVHLRSGETAIYCYDCDRTSFHPEDVKNAYCANCHRFLQDLMRRIK